MLVAAMIAGCASAPHTRRFSSSVFRSSRHVSHPTVQGLRAEPRRDEGASGIVERLHEAGFHFGTDGTAAALWGYMRTSHQIIRPDEAAAGDIIFFDTLTRDGGDQRACGDRVGVIERVDPDGRITFSEASGGEIRRSYVDPRAPLRRRDDGGEVLNSFLRPKKIGDPDGTRHFAGEMLCGVARVRWRR